MQGFKKLYKINIFQHREFLSKPFHSLTLPSFPDEARTVPVTFHWTLQTYTKLKKQTNETKYFAKKEFDKQPIFETNQSQSLKKQPHTSYMINIQWQQTNF